MGAGDVKRAGLALLLTSLLLAACSSSFESSELNPETERPEAPSGPTFVDITEAAGIAFTHDNGASSHRLLPETMGAGAAFFDFDGDGLPDLYLVNGVSLDGKGAGRPGALYKNLGEGRFRDVTRGSGLEQAFFGMGTAVGDVDNDGFTDLFVSGVGEQHLYRNLGNGRFQDITSQSGLVSGGFGTSAAFLDYDRDGFLDLFVGRYIEWSPASDIPCSPDGVHQTYCTPEGYPSVSSRLYHNLNGNGFEDVTAVSRIGDAKGKALGVVVFDHNRDGWPDIAVANDTVRNFLFLNQKNGSFQEVGVSTGMAFSESGAARGGMGIDAGDLDGNGLLDLVVGNFSQEMSAYFRATHNGFFIDDAARSGFGMATLLTLAFGTLLEDFNNDGLLDVLVVNGHIEPDIDRTQPGQSYRQKSQLFWNTPKGIFLPAEGPPGSALDSPLVARGLAGADIDLDGDIDVVITQNGGSARLFRDEQSGGNWLRLRLQGRQSNRNGYGARIRVLAGSSNWTRELSSGRSYLSACEPVLTLGLGETQKVDRIEISWPSGILQVIDSPTLNTVLDIQEPE